MSGAPPASIQFVLNAFESAVQMSVAGNLETQPIPALTTDATAVLQVAVSDMQNVFKFESDSSDITDLDATDIKYYVYADKFPALNPANGMMDAPDSKSPIATTDSAGPLASNKMMVAHDFVRYLAVKLFNTHFGVDLFNNEVALLQNLRLICSDDAAGHTWKDIVDKLTSVSIGGDNAGLLTDAAGNKYMTNGDKTASNLCRVLMEQMLGADATRFAQIVASDGPQSLPFKPNDSISFKVTISPADGQELLTGTAVIPPRSYEIKLLLVDGSVANTEVDAAEA